MQSGKKMATDVSASAKAGMEKATATAQEKVEKMTTRDPMAKVEKMTTRDPMAKERAEVKKEERKQEAEMKKQAAQHEAGGHARVGGTGPGGPTGGLAGLNPAGVHTVPGSTGTNPAGLQSGGRFN